MARPGLTRHYKFHRLAHSLGSVALAYGHLELLWESAYECGEDFLGDARDVERVAVWKGPEGKLTSALMDAGFIDEESGTYRVHDLYDHAPDYVRRRMEREAARLAKGKTIRDLRSAAGRKGASVKANLANESKRQSLADPHEAKVSTRARAPARAPALALARLRGDEAAAPPLSENEAATDPRHAPLVKSLTGIAQAFDSAWAFDGGKDARQVTLLLAKADPAEVEGRWARALRHRGFPTVRTLADLVLHWNRFPGEPAPLVLACRKEGCPEPAGLDGFFCDPHGREWAAQPPGQST